MNGKSRRRQDKARRIMFRREAFKRMLHGMGIPTPMIHAFTGPEMRRLRDQVLSHQKRPQGRDPLSALRPA